MANGWHPRRRARYSMLSTDEQLGQMWDEIDDIDSKGTERSREIAGEVESLQRAYAADELRRAREQNRILVMVVMSLIGVLASIIVPLITR